MRKRYLIVGLIVAITLTLVSFGSIIGEHAVEMAPAGIAGAVDAAITNSSGSLTASPQNGTPGISPEAPRPLSEASGAIAKGKPWDNIDFGSRRLSNNVWGAPADETLSCSIYTNPGRGFGWYWGRNNPKPRPGETSTKPIYPSVRTGGSPWEPSNTALFPVKVGDIKSLEFEVAYNYPVAPTGYFNLAYDMFLSDTNQPSSSPKPKAEIMIWLHHTFPQPPEAYQGDFTDGANTYEFYSWVMTDGRLYYSFVMKDQSPWQAQHTVDAKKLIDRLGLDRGWYIHGVELGNEIVTGSGKIEIGKFNINVNGSNL